MAPPVLLAHGFSTSGARTWGENGWIDLIEESGRTVMAPDLPGHGSAPKPDDPLAYEHMHRALLDGLPDEPVDAVGFSLGSRLLLTLAGEQPERFRQLVITGAGEDLLRPHDYRPIIETLRRPVDGEPDEDEHPIGAYFRRSAEASGSDPRVLAAVLERPTNRPLTDAELARVSCPVTVVVGENDFAGPGEPLVARLPDARLVTVPGLDHFSTPKSFDVIDTVLRLLDQPPRP